jgi:shikimate 5-dehydrogenase
MDTVYAPRETPLLIHARSRGARAVDGWVMFTKQAERQFRLWNTD